MIDRTIKNIKNTLILTAKISEKKNTLQGFGGDTYSKNSKYKNFLFCLSYI